MVGFWQDRQRLSISHRCVWVVSMGDFFFLGGGGGGGLEVEGRGGIFQGFDVNAQPIRPKTPTCFCLGTYTQGLFRLEFVGGEGWGWPMCGWL